MTGVLVVDDDRPLTRALAINLRAHGYQVTLAHDGRSALAEVTRVHPAVVILDLGLPDLDGIDVLTGIRGWSAVPVIVLSARSNSAEKVEALDAGADVYDLRGITDTLDADDSHVGLIQFKVGTGGEAVEYAGEWDLPINRAIYRAFDLYMSRR